MPLVGHEIPNTRGMNCVSLKSIFKIKYYTKLKFKLFFKNKQSKSSENKKIGL